MATKRSDRPGGKGGEPRKPPSKIPGEGERTEVAEIDPSMFDEDIPTDVKAVPRVNVEPEPRDDTPPPRRDTPPPPRRNITVTPVGPKREGPKVEPARAESRAKAEPPPRRDVSAQSRVPVQRQDTPSSSRRLTLPKPGEHSGKLPEDDAAPPAPRARSSRTTQPPAPSSPQRTTQPPAAAKRSTIPPPRAPEKSAISKYGLIGVLVAGMLIAGVFVWAATRSPATIEGTPIAATAPAEATVDGMRKVGDTYVVGGGREPSPVETSRTLRMDRSVTYTPREGTALMTTEKREKRRAMLYGFREAGGEQQRWGFEAVERPKKREYEDKTPPPNMPSMLIIFSDPPGVAVDVDGQLVGVTPLMRLVPPDKARFDVRLWGGAYKDHKASVTKGSDGNYTLGVTMESKAPRPELALPQPAKPTPPHISTPFPVDPDERAKKKGAN